MPLRRFIRNLKRSLRKLRSAASRPDPFDVVIEGQSGLFTIQPLSPAGKRWCRKHLHASRHVMPRGNAFTCEGDKHCRSIAMAMDRSGLRAKVNGVDMLGFGREAKRLSDKLRTTEARARQFDHSPFSIAFSSL
jgi:hypothetical protein